MPGKHRPRAAAALMAVATVVPLGLWAPASAHEEGGVVMSAIVESVSPHVEGLSVKTLLSVAPLLEVRNDTGLEVIVLGEEGEPFLRLGAGAIEGNRRSPTLYRSADPFGGRPLPRRADAAAAPNWQRLGSADTWRWFDPRLRVTVPSHGRVSFAVPMRVGDSPVVVRGYVKAGELGHFRSVLEERPRIRGLELTLLEGRIPAFFVRNASDRVLEVVGSAGEPMLRIGPTGVRANMRSPSYYLAGSQTIRPVPPKADARARPAWRELAGESAWAWLEYRARVPGRGERPFALGSHPKTVLRWTTPLRWGGRALTVAGRVDWVPAVPAAEERNGPRAWSMVLGALLVIAPGVTLTGAARALIRSRRPISTG